MTDKKAELEAKEKARFEALTPEEQKAELDAKAETDAKAGAEAKKPKEEPFLIGGKKQYWKNKVLCGELVSGLVTKNQVKLFFKNSKNSKYSDWMGEVDLIEKRIEDGKRRMRKRSGIKE